MLLIAIVVGYYVTRWPIYKTIITSNEINITVYRIQLVVDEKAQPDSYIRHTTL